MNEQEFEELAAAHALHALSPDDEHRFTDALAAHPEWQATVDQDAATAAALADATPELAPPASARSALFAAIDGGQAAPPAPAEPARPAEPDAARRRSRFSRRGWFALAASIVLVLALGISGIFIARQFAAPASTFALQQIEKQPDAQSETVDVTGGGTATAHWSGSLGKAVLVSDNLTPIATDKTYEMWFVRDGTAVSAGQFEASDGDATAALDGRMHVGDVIAVTVEPSGGSPTGKPTSTPIVAIPTA